MQATDPTLGLRERKKIRTRETIRREAFRLIEANGYAATTVEQIAEAAEVSPSTFFRYFKTKEDVLIQDRYDDMMVELIRAAPPELTPVEVVRRAILGAFTQVGPEEVEQIRQRSRLAFSVPAVRMRPLDNMLT